MHMPPLTPSPLAMTPVEERESIKVLRAAIDLQVRKGSDYQADTSTVRQADYYPRGVDTLWDLAYQKLLRMRSVMDKSKANQGSANYESLEDSAIDGINYLSFFVAFLRGKMDGQREDRDEFGQAR